MFLTGALGKSRPRVIHPESNDAKKRRRSERAMIVGMPVFVDRRSVVSRRWSSSDFSAPFESFAESYHVGVLEITPHWEAARNPGYGDSHRLDDFRQIERCRFTVHRRSGRDDHFPNTALLQTLEQLFDPQRVRAN